MLNYLLQINVLFVFMIASEYKEYILSNVNVRNKLLFETGATSGATSGATFFHNKNINEKI